jgi:hypothetical protein
VNGTECATLVSDAGGATFASEELHLARLADSDGWIE